MLTGNITVYSGDGTLLEKADDYFKTHTGVYDDFTKLAGDYRKGQFPFDAGVVNTSKEEIAKSLKS